MIKEGDWSQSVSIHKHITQTYTNTSHIHTQVHTHIHSYTLTDHIHTHSYTSQERDMHIPRIRGLLCWFHLPQAGHLFTNIWWAIRKITPELTSLQKYKFYPPHKTAFITTAKKINLKKKKKKEPEMNTARQILERCLAEKAVGKWGKSC